MKSLTIRGGRRMIVLARKWMITLMVFSVALTTVFAAGVNEEASAAVVSPNLIKNPGFESGSLTDWSVSGTNAVIIKNAVADVHSGSHAVNYWFKTPYAFKLKQTITGLENGTYELKAWASGGGGDFKLKLFAEGFGGDMLSSDAVNTGYNVWKQYTVTDIEVTNGQVTIGFDVEAPGDVWGYFDDFELVKVSSDEPSEPEEFIKGVDISTLQAIEAKGIKYYEGGVEKDLLSILKDHGVNYVRLRVWNNPVEAEGFNDKAHLIALAERVKAAGMKLLVDFHYSDFWADPGKQVKPEAWENLDFTGLKQAVYDYTKEVLNELKTVGAYPDMVQIGNEINNGMMHPEGSVSNFGQLAELLKEGVKAVRDTTPVNHTTKIMIHLAEGGDNHKFRSFFDEVEDQNVDYDVIGMSYYPYWHGTFQQLKTNMNDMAARYGKQIVVAETAYPFTLDNGDQQGNIAGADQVRITGLPATPGNQKLVTETVMNTVAHVEGGKGLGVFYWEPAWLPGVGWKAGEGNGWENQAMFDFEGNALSSLDAFLFTPGSISVVSPIMVYASPAITIAKGGTPAMPAKADVLYNEGSILKTNVVWDNIAEEKLNTPGTFTVNGTVNGLSQKATIEITVLTNPNLVKNPSFENGDLTDWTVTGTTAAGKIHESTGNSHSGSHAFNYWYGSPYAYQLKQTITGLEAGTYVLKAWSSGGGGDKRLKLFAENTGGTTLSKDMVNTGYNVWKQYAVENIQVNDGQLTIGFDVEAPNDIWGYFDDIELVQVAKAPTDTGNSSNSGSTNESGGVTVTPDQISRTEDGIRKVELPANTSEVILPSGIYDQLKNEPLKFDTGSLSIEIPSELFKELQSKLPDVEKSTITLKLLPLEKAKTEEILSQSGENRGNTQVKVAGQVYDFKLSIKNEAGNETILSQFSKPITIRLKPDSTINSQHAGIYYIADDGRLEYVGGKWINGELVAQIEHFSMYAVLEVTKQYDDVAAGYWAHDIIAQLAGKQIIQGTTAAAFEPRRSISRAEFAALLVRTLKLKGQTENIFNDVPASAWYADEVSAAYRAGIVKGRSASLFEPNAPITRQEMAVMLLKAYSIKTGSSAASEEPVPFIDSDKIDEWAMESIQSAHKLGLIQGREQNRFAPKAYMTRAEATQAIYRLLAI